MSKPQPKKTPTFFKPLQKTGSGGYLGIGPKNGHHNYLPNEDTQYKVKRR